MRGLVPRIHVFRPAAKAWMAGTSPAMTTLDPMPIETCCRHAATTRQDPLSGDSPEPAAWTRVDSDGEKLAMNDIRSKELYSSPNGDRWHLCKDGTGRLFIAHQANLPSGGHISRIELADFLARGYGPEQQSLLKLIGTLLDPAPAQLVGGEGDPGLSLTGGGGHA